MITRQTCPSCHSDDLLVVKLTPRDTPMRFATCRHCENRWWEDLDAGTGIGLRSVIDELSAARV